MRHGFRWFVQSQREGEGISPWVGLSLGALCFAAVLGIGAAAMHLQRSALSEQRQQNSKETVRWLARYLASIHEADTETINRELRRAAQAEDIQFCAVVNTHGVISAHSDPQQIGSPAAGLSWQDTNELGIRVGTMPDRNNEVVLSTRILSPSGLATTDQLRVGLEPLALSWAQSQLLFWGAYVLLVVLAIYVVIYRLLRREVRPMAVIRRQLLNCQKPTTERLHALRLNDSFDQVSTSWNGLIEFVSEMHEQLRKSQLTADVTGALDGYRSERLTDILMQIPFGVLVVDANRTISFANRSACGMLGATDQELENSTAESFFDEPLRLALFSSDNTQRSGHAPTSRWIDHTFDRPHGEVVLRFWSIPSDRNGDEYILFLQDVTQVKEAERARDRFVYHITHELRTPLTNIRAYAETLSQGVIDDEQTIRECYNVIMGETQRLNRLVEDILNVSQLEIGSARLNISEVKPEELIRKVVQDMQGSADRKNLDLLLSIPAKVPRIRGDKDRLTVVLTNLVGNAIKYTPEGGRVDVQCAVENNRIQISVSDTGIGIDTDDQEKIFDKFYRVNDTRVAATPGTGLGLAIVKETMRLHGGSVGVKSTLEKGTTFTIALPALSIDESASGHAPGSSSMEAK